MRNTDSGSAVPTDRTRVRSGIFAARLGIRQPQQSQSKYEIKSNPDGHYEFVGLPAGNYTLLCEFMGFATLKREGIALSGQPFQVNAVMQVGSIMETITVSDKVIPRPSPINIVRDRARLAQQPDPCASSQFGGCLQAPV